MEVKIYSSDKILIVAPHADDESIGCGGLMALYGHQCDLLLLTDGRRGHTTKEYSDENKLIKIRKNEFVNVAKIAKIDSIFFANIEDGTVARNKKKVYLFDISKYNYIFVPNRYESHPDHKIVYSIFKYMRKKQKSKAKIYEYEVWTPLRHPTWFLDITKVQENKNEMIRQHESQIADIDYVTKGMALSCYRGMFIGVEYAEAYAFSDYSGIKKIIYNLLSYKLKKIVRKRLAKIYE